jgi:hypothetical protein
MASLGDLPATLFSPTKMVYISYVVLTGLKILPPPNLWEFLGLSLAFLVIEIGHNDYLRIVLNRKGERVR